MIHFKHLDAEVQNYILDSYLVINNKIDLLAFAVKPNEDRTISFFGKEGKVLTSRKRILVDFYDEAMEYFNNRQNILFTSDFIGKTFFMEYYDKHSSNLRKPFKAPKNNFILSYVKENKKVIPPNSKIINLFAEKLEIDPPPVIWTGTLNEDQKKFLLELAYADEITSKTFSEMFVLFPLAQEYINKYNFEGLVLYYQEDTNWEMVKIVDPKYTEKIKEKIKKEEESREAEEEQFGVWFDKQTMMILEHLASTSIDGWDFLTEAFLHFLKTKPYEKLTSEKMTFFDINISKLPPLIQRELLLNPKSKPLFRHLFYIFTAPSIKRIASKYNMSTDVVIKLEAISDSLNLKNLELYDELSHKDKETEKTKDHKVSLIVGRFQPPHSGHIKMVKEFAKYPPVFCIVYSKNNKRSPFPPEIIEEIFDKMIEDGYLPKNTKYYINSTGYIPDFIENHELNVGEILAGKDRIDGYRDQFPEDTDIEFITTIRYFRGEDIREWIKSEDRFKLETALPSSEYVSWYIKLLKPFL